MDKRKLEELEELKEDIQNKYEENFKLDNNSVIIILMKMKIPKVQ